MQREREKQTLSRDVYADAISYNTSRHWNGPSEPKREIEIKINTRRINNKFSKELLHTERPEPACSHTCKLSIIYRHNQKDRGKERQTKTQNKTYIRTISDNIAEHKYKQSEKKRDRDTDQET